ncbi:MAG: caspase domain-containing protein [Cyanobacteriota bacterium]
MANSAEWPAVRTAAAPQGLAPRTSGLPLRLKAYERSRSVAISADASHFALGGDWYLRLFQADGRERWNTPTPGVAWLVNLSPDGRFVVAALPVGTATALLDGEATAARIQAELSRFSDSSRIQPNDVFVLYLAGHGVTDVRGDYVFKTVEASADGSGGLGGRQLLDLLASIPSTHLVVVLDTCAAGSFRDAFRIDLTLRRLNEVSGRAVLAGSASQGSALEHPSLGGGLFTGVLLSGLGGAANNDGNEEGSVQEALVASSGRCFTNPTMISASPARTSAVEGRWNARGGPGWPPWRRGWPGASAASGCSTTGSTRRSLPGPAWMSTCPSSTATKAS